MKRLFFLLITSAILVLAGTGATEPIFFAYKIDGPAHDPVNGSFWYGPFSEGSAVFDVNGDGRLDITSGVNWYEGPGFKKHSGYRGMAPRVGEFVSNNGERPIDVDGDGLMDLMSSGWQTNGFFWFRNPGKPGVEWPATRIMESVQTEGFIVEDLDGDGDEDVVVGHWGPMEGQGVTWIENLGSARFAPHILGPEGDHHGIGLGDLDGDGRKDIITPRGWWKAPEDRSGGQWSFREDYRTEQEAGIRMIVHDVNGDGRADIIYGHGHNYGLFWLEQTAPAGGALTFERHQIEDSLGQFHTLVLADVDQDGALDLVTGKRLRGHNGSDPSGKDPMGLFWYEIDGGRFLRHVLAYNHTAWYASSGGVPPNDAIGTGMNINVVDVTEDGRVDIIVSGKSGLYLLVNQGEPEPVAVGE